MSASMRRLVDEDSAIVVWWLTRTECVSAFERRAREGGLRRHDARRARQILQSLATVWSEMQPTDSLRTAAERLLGLHDLRTADALQLAAALEWCGGRPQGLEFLCLDARLRRAAEREGFDVQPEEA